MSSYFVAFSNDTRDWTTLHDGYAEWVSGGGKEGAAFKSQLFEFHSVQLSLSVVLRKRGQEHAGEESVFHAHRGSLPPHPSPELERQLVSES